MAHGMACSFNVCLCVLSFAVLSICREGSLNAPTVDAEDVLVKWSFWTDLLSVGLWGLPRPPFLTSPEQHCLLSVTCIRNKSLIFNTGEQRQIH